MRSVRSVGSFVAAAGDASVIGELAEGDEVAVSGLVHLEKLAPKD
jgi:hypothetical protein